MAGSKVSKQHVNNGQHDSVGQYPDGQALTKKYITSNKIGVFEPYHWIQLAFNDFYKAPVLSLIYGALFSLIPASILYFAYSTGNWMYLLPAAMAFSLIGPAFASGLYDVAWELEKGHKPTLKHSLKSLWRNPVGEWSFAVILLILMLAWMRLAGLIYALYPAHANPSLSDMSAFLILGTLVGAAMTGIGFAISAFTPQILLERKVDVMTAVVSSVNAVRNNAAAMLFWAALVFSLVLVGFLFQAVAFIVIMPILSYASWHGYIAVIKTKRERKFE